ncbi:curli assembly protein CsgF [Verrucomicrobia bacterium]|nr:curli assembly protein CsgF [Verrucomicrobiota bacterium]|tara:strand:- start:110 stop:616 length:507 start_codon:yes stop_codon:yes gene_type:complete
MHKKIKEKIKAMSTYKILLTYSVVSLVVLSFIFFNKSVQADEILHKFKSPSFSGVNSSSHYLTIENQEATRKQAIKEEIEAYTDQLAREQDNTTLARFIRNLESRIYAQLSRQMVEQLFGETPQKQGKLTLEGNTIEYIVEDDTITLTVTDESGGTTNITVPIGDFTF